MFPSQGYFLYIDCPDFIEGRCNRPNCLFAHKGKTHSGSKSRPKTSQEQTLEDEIIHPKTNPTLLQEQKCISDMKNVLLPQRKEQDFHLPSHNIENKESTNKLSSNDDNLRMNHNATISATIPPTILSTDNQDTGTSQNTSDLLQHLISEAVKKVLSENSGLSSAIVDTNAIARSLDTSSLISKAVREVSVSEDFQLETDKERKQPRLYLPPPGTPSYKPTPISQLQQKNIKEKPSTLSVEKDDEYKPAPINNAVPSNDDEITDFSTDEEEHSNETKSEFDMLEEVLVERSSDPSRKKAILKRKKALGKQASCIVRSKSVAHEKSKLSTNKTNSNSGEPGNSSPIADTFHPPSPIFTSPIESNIGIYIPVNTKENRVDSSSPISNEAESNSENVVVKPNDIETSTKEESLLPASSVSQPTLVTSTHNLLPQIAELSQPNFKSWSPVAKVDSFLSVEKMLEQLDSLPSGKKKVLHTDSLKISKSSVYSEERKEDRVVATSVAHESNSIARDDEQSNSSHTTKENEKDSFSQSMNLESDIKEKSKHAQRTHHSKKRSKRRRRSRSSTTSFSSRSSYSESEELSDASLTDSSRRRRRRESSSSSKHRKHKSKRKKMKHKKKKHHRNRSKSKSSHTRKTNSSSSDINSNNSSPERHSQSKSSNSDSHFPLVSEVQIKEEKIEPDISIVKIEKINLDKDKSKRAPSIGASSLVDVPFERNAASLESRIVSNASNSSRSEQIGSTTPSTNNSRGKSITSTSPAVKETLPLELELNTGEHKCKPVVSGSYKQSSSKQKVLKVIDMFDGISKKCDLSKKSPVRRNSSTDRSSSQHKDKKESKKASSQKVEETSLKVSCKTSSKETTDANRISVNNGEAVHKENKKHSTDKAEKDEFKRKDSSNRAEKDKLKRKGSTDRSEKDKFKRKGSPDSKMKDNHKSKRRTTSQQSKHGSTSSSKRLKSGSESQAQSRHESRSHRREDSGSIRSSKNGESTRRRSEKEKLEETKDISMKEKLSSNESATVGMESPIPDLSALDEIPREEWDQLLSGTLDLVDGHNEADTDEEFQPGGFDDSIDTDEVNDPRVLEECMKVFSEYKPEQITAPVAVPKKEAPKSSDEYDIPTREKRVAHSGATGNLVAKPKALMKPHRKTPEEVMLERYKKLKEEEMLLQKKLELQRKQLEKHGQVPPRSSTSSSIPAKAFYPVSSSNSVSSSAVSKKRIARAPSNVSALLKSKDKLISSHSGKRPSTANASVKQEEPKTLAMTVNKGEKRVAHTPNFDTLERPIVSTEEGTKVPQNVRQRYLNCFIDETVKFCDGKEVAFNVALAEEIVCHKRATTRMVYLNLAVNVLKKLRASQISEAAQNLLDTDPKFESTKGVAIKSPSSVPSSSATRKSFEHPINPNHRTVSHFSVMASGGQKGSWSIKKAKKSLPDNIKDYLTGPKFYNCLKKYILNREQLDENGFPRPDPTVKGKAVVKKVNCRKKINPNEYERYCDRCSVLYEVDEWGFPLKTSSCAYHWGRAYRRRVVGGVESRYSCCQGDSQSEGCCLASTHVSENFSPHALTGYMRTIPKDPNSQGDFGVFALDCEMCYTTAGTELTRITVIDTNCKSVYETVVKPDNPIIDYNTRFSGITEADLEGVTVTLRDVQAALLTRFSEKTILMGHSLESDFQALKAEWVQRKVLREGCNGTSKKEQNLLKSEDFQYQHQLIHDTVVDTSVVFPHKLGPPFKRALRNLASEYLTKIIQNDVSGHDSAEDAITCMELMHWKVKEDLKGQL